MRDLARLLKERDGKQTVDLDQRYRSERADRCPMAGIDWVHVVGLATLILAVSVIGIMLFAM
ncbi:hypothetical protein CQ12_30350 [Bradyrhizobium jicamae]|uniref:Uncharacterized protein n=1 Tax=Bradyrhizobium jicamae TaxID=280332 RepID=A0A0R3KBQ7_9BRAD|nr:hypothetical protein [Bradyrhizobium jicamae]KRQ92920.1 hypothetical protein CQ12_30350 [Bradyrhizobium jicamae]